MTTPNPTPHPDEWVEKAVKSVPFDEKTWVGTISEELLRDILESARTHYLEQGRREAVREIIPKHNARILNQFQLQGTADMPMIAYDERVCLIPAMEKATKETLESIDLSTKETRG